MRKEEQRPAVLQLTDCEDRADGENASTLEYTESERRRTSVDCEKIMVIWTVCLFACLQERGSQNDGVREQINEANEQQRFFGFDG